MQEFLNFATSLMLAGMLTSTTVLADSLPSKLVIGLLPGESAPTVIRLNEPLRAYLEKRLGLPVEIVVGANYAATGAALRFGRLDVAYLGPVTYVLQSRKVKLEPVARPSHPGVGPSFKAVIIVPADSPAQNLAELRGKEIAFGDPASTSGTWVPQYMLWDAGLAPGRDYVPHSLGAHDAVALAVQNGRVAGGGLSQPIYQRLISEGKLDAGKVRVLQESPPIPEYMWTLREGIDPAFRKKLTQALLEMNDPEALKVFRADAFVPAKDSDVDPVRRWVEAVEKAAAL